MAKVKQIVKQEKTKAKKFSGNWQFKAKTWLPG